jgi:hypothetical protein
MQKEKVGNRCCAKDNQECGRSRVEGKIAAALLMDIKGAFLSVAKGNLIKRLEDMGFEVDVCRWTESFMSNRKATIKMDRRKGEVMDMEA